MSARDVDDAITVAAIMAVADDAIMAADIFGPAICPRQSSDMSLTEVAYWIATKGGAEDIRWRDVEAWRAAFDTLLGSIVAGECEVFGRRPGTARSEKLAPHEFNGVLVEYPCDERFDLVFERNRPHLECSASTRDERWSGGRGDSLWSGDLRPDWENLWIKGSAAAKLWPFQDQQVSPGEDSYYSLPPDEPRQPQPAAAYRALVNLYGHKVPKLSTERLARRASLKSKEMGGPRIGRDDVRRALGLRQ